jgi:hypothetical protein
MMRVNGFIFGLLTAGAVIFTINCVKTLFCVGISSGTVIDPLNGFVSANTRFTTLVEIDTFFDCTMHLINVIRFAQDAPVPQDVSRLHIPTFIEDGEVFEISYFVRELIFSPLLDSEIALCSRIFSVIDRPLPDIIMSFRFRKSLNLDFCYDSIYLDLVNSNPGLHSSFLNTPYMQLLDQLTI